MAKYKGETEYLGAWSYAFLGILYSIPIIGIIFLLLHSFSNNNENRRHYARSFFAKFLLAILIGGSAFLIMYFIIGPEEFALRFELISASWNDFFKSFSIPIK